MAGDASRSEKAALAQLAKCVPDETLLPILKQLLDDELQQFRAFRIEAEARGWQRGPAVNGLCTPAIIIVRSKRFVRPKLPA
jgi:hypothetical protein